MRDHSAPQLEHERKRINTRISVGYGWRGGKSEEVLRKRVSASDKETRDRAERGSAVRGSARVSVLAQQHLLRLTARDELNVTRG